ncbi:equilibrative nucleotide transporter 7-like [Silene latifolia]|uniref:equilibrative nucleotide transporter 7-like n=1 Tax=Silene latifolia TaxID=37657 RepID=UPI003D77EACF
MLPEFMQSFFVGWAASGALISGFRLITKSAYDKSPNSLRKGAILFFPIATAIEFLYVFLYDLCFLKLPIVKYFRAKSAPEGPKLSPLILLLSISTR